MRAYITFTLLRLFSFDHVCSEDVVVPMGGAKAQGGVPCDSFIRNPDGSWPELYGEVTEIVVPMGGDAILGFPNITINVSCRAACAFATAPPLHTCADALSFWHANNDGADGTMGDAKLVPEPPNPNPEERLVQQPGKS